MTADATTPKLNKIFTDDVPQDLTKEQLASMKQVKAVRTTPRDLRFPSTNQAGHCWNRYNEWILCVKNTGGSEDDCAQLRQYATSICPTHWTEKWDEERGEGTFAGLQ
jgi:cytochrome c oxidase subunit 6b